MFPFRSTAGPKSVSTGSKRACNEKGHVRHWLLSRTLGFLFKTLDGQACFPYHYGAPENKASDAHGAREESEDSNDIEGEVLAGSCKLGPYERDEGGRGE